VIPAIACWNGQVYHTSLAASHASARLDEWFEVHCAIVNADSTPTDWAAGVCAGLYAAGSRHVVYVPDNPLSNVFKILRHSYTDVEIITATREEEAFGIAAGLYLGGARATVMLQSSGLGNSLNALTSLLVPYQIPVLALVSMRGDAGEWNIAQVSMGRALGAICDAIGVHRAVVERPGTAAATVHLVGMTAFGTRIPGICQLPRRITVPAPAPEARP
jgi:sulfopyruvate decarboxylase alpha subunit